MDWRHRITLTVPEVGTVTGLKPQQVAELIEAGELTATRAAGQVLVHVESVLQRFGPEPRPSGDAEEDLTLPPRLERILHDVTGCPE